MSHDTIHGASAVSSAALISGGAWLAFGIGYGMIALGALLLLGTINARTRGHARNID